MAKSLSVSWRPGDRCRCHSDLRPSLAHDLSRLRFLTALKIILHIESALHEIVAGVRNRFWSVIPVVHAACRREKKMKRSGRIKSIWQSL